VRKAAKMPDDVPVAECILKEILKGWLKIAGDFAA
jgi:hypothetical protein